jgi:hypothetical protein
MSFVRVFYCLPESSSASRLTAGTAAFLNFIATARSDKAGRIADKSRQQHWA